MTSEVKNRIQIACITGIIIGGAIGAVATAIHFNNGRRSSLYYCVSEIKTYENYTCGFAYFYEELESESENKNEQNTDYDLYGYYITTITEDRKGEWYCMIGCKPNFILKGYNPEDVVFIDCDLVFETIYG